MKRGVVVTGGGAGIGLSIAEAFRRLGDLVHIGDIDAAAVEKASHLGLTGTMADVADRAAVDRIFDDAQRHLGRLDILVNNAGISGPVGRIDAISPDEWDETIAVNLTGQFLCARRAVPELVAAGGGSIINVSSTAGMMGYPLRAAYASSKWAVVGLTKTLAMELGEVGIRVNAVCPGSVDGPRMDRVIEAEASARGVEPSQVRASYLSQSSLRTFIDAAEVAAAVLFLCSPEASQISGQAIAVDGHTETLRT